MLKRINRRSKVVKNLDSSYPWTWLN